MSYFVYIIESKIYHKYYIGQTNDLQERIKRHNSGRNRYTKTDIPWELRWWKEFDTRSEAITEEQILKNINRRQRLEKYTKENNFRGVAQPG